MVEAASVRRVLERDGRLPPEEVGGAEITSFIRGSGEAKEIVRWHILLYWHSSKKRTGLGVFFGIYCK